MTKIWMHELAAAAGPLMDRLRSVLAQTDTSAARELLGRAQIEEHERPSMVLTGQFSGGKSTLIEALTDRAVRPPTGADYTTDEVTEYAWSGAVTLVDTPGVKSGVRTHDELAKDAVANSDFILYVVDVGLFDDASRDYLRHLAHHLRKADQMIVAITKCKKMSAPPGSREDAVRHALGTSTLTLPVVEVDAMYYLRSLDGGSHEGLLRRESNIDALKDLINRVSESRGQLAQLRRPFQLIRQLCDEAQEHYVADESERLALSVLASQRRAIGERRAMIETSFTAAATKFRSDCLTDVTAFVDTASSLPQDATQAISAAEQKLVAALNRHGEALGNQVNILAQHQFDVLADEIGGISESNRAAALLRYSGTVTPGTPSSIQIGARQRDSVPPGSRDRAEWLRDVGSWLKEAQTMWGAGGGVKASAGSAGHKIVKDVGHFFGAKFEPWQAVKIANVVGKAAKAAGFVITVGMSAYEVLDNERAAHRAQIEAERRHAAFVTEIMGYADAIAVDARRQLAGIIDPPMNEFVAHIDGIRDRIIESHEQRDVRLNEVVSIAREADRLLELTSRPTVIDGE
jgi:predicted GTPase